MRIAGVIASVTLVATPCLSGDLHRHPGHVFVYVVEGLVEMQMEGGELHTLKPGDTFYENPKDTHPVGRNVSKTEPAKLLVFFVTDQNTPLVLPPQR